MPKPCPRCGLENADEAARCRRCDAPLPAAAAITPAFRRFLLWLAAFFVISAIGVAALVWVHRTAVPLDEPVGPRIDPAAQEEAFAREQALDAPPPVPGANVAPPAPGPALPVPQPPAPGADAPAAPEAGGASGTAGNPDPLPGEEDVTDQMPPVAPGVDWSRAILPPTGRPAPPTGTPAFPPAPQAGDSPAFPESDPATSFPPNAPQAPEAGPADASPDAGTAPGQTEAPPAQGQEQAPADAPPPGSSRSLAEVQRIQCAGEGFLTRFVCHERVRLAYCENRWNRHPDCMVDSNATNY